MITEPLKWAKLIAGRIPAGATITGTYEQANGRKWALVTLANGNEVAFCSGAMRRIDTRKVIRKGNRAYEVKVEWRTSVPRHVATAPVEADEQLTRS
jgi:hypothetical protein